VILVVAMARNRVIGRNNGLPWHLPADLQHFKRTTMGKPILMGRRTFESIGKPLPGRTNLVLTRAAQWTSPGVVTVHSIEEALQQSGAVPELAGIGGAQVFELLLPLAERIHLTRIDAEFEGDTWFPVLPQHSWQELDVQRRPADERNPYDMEFVTLQRVRAGAG
jgi:dihydrofolate reductase